MEPRPHLPAGEQTRAPRRYPGRPPKYNAANGFDAFVRRRFPGRSKVDLIALFDGLANYRSIRGWRRGERAMPQWARDLLQRKIAAHAASELEALASMPKRPKPGTAGREALRRYHAARRASKS